MTKTIAIMQSNYIPWKGYFDLARCCDDFVILDTVQYTKNDWRNRNQIFVNGKPHWLTIPVQTSGNFGQNINETKVIKGWHKKHWKTIAQAYAKSPFFYKYSDIFRSLYEMAGEMEYLSDINRLFINEINKCLNITTSIQDSNQWPNLSSDPSQRVFQIVQLLEGTQYLSGKAAQSYLDLDLFQQAEINVIWANYSNYGTYPQISDTFSHNVSVLDMLFNLGDNAKHYLSDINK